MQPSARDAYLETQVLTATPQKLRLMLIEGAIRFVHQTQHYWELGRAEEALESSIRAREIVSELMSSLAPEKSPFASQMLPVYGYIFRTLTEAQLQQSTEKLADALRILGEERETWSQVCEKFVDFEADLEGPVEITAPQTLPEPVAVASAPLSFDSERIAAMPIALPTAEFKRAAPQSALPQPASQGVSFEA